MYKVLCLKRNNPEIYDRTYQFHLVPDWLIKKLTGVNVTSESTSVLAGALDIANKRRWDEDLLKEFGLRTDIFIPDIRPAGEVVGKVTKEGERLFGIPAGIPVVTAAGDQPCGCFGAGQFETGSISVNGGTSCTSEILSATIPSLNHPITL